MGSAWSGRQSAPCPKMVPTAALLHSTWLSLPPSQHLPAALHTPTGPRLLLQQAPQPLLRRLVARHAGRPRDATPNKVLAAGAGQRGVDGCLQLVVCILEWGAERVEMCVKWSRSRHEEMAARVGLQHGCLGLMACALHKGRKGEDVQ